MKVKKYSFVGASKLDKRKAKLVGECIAKLGDNGRVTPQIVVRSAESPRSPLHEFFEWDNTEAARRYRLMQAGHLLRSLKIEYVDLGPQRKKGSIRAFMSIKEHKADDKPIYIPTISVLSDADLRARLIARALSELEAWTARYKSLDELSNIFEAIETSRRDRRKAA